jgi:DNA-binding PucR family transcriptional regulator
VLADDALGEILVERYVTPIRALGAFGEELLQSLRVFARHDQNIDAAAQELFVHPNTLRHRLSRFEETTGANLHNVEQLAEIWWAMTLAEAGRAPDAFAN